MTNATFTNGAIFGGAATQGTNHELLSISTSTTTYSILEGSAATSDSNSGTTEFREITAFASQQNTGALTTANAGLLMSGRNLSRGAANATGSFSFSKNLSEYVGFAIFEFILSAGNDSTWFIEAVDNVGVVVATYDAGASGNFANFGGVALQGPAGGWYNGNSTTRIPQSAGPQGLFFTSSDFSAPLTNAVALRTRAAGNTTTGDNLPDTFSLVAVSVPEPSSVLLGILGLIPLLRRRRS